MPIRSFQDNAESSTLRLKFRTCFQTMGMIQDTFLYVFDLLDLLE